MTVEFTQYLRPNDRRVKQFIDCPKDVEDKAKAVIVHGGRFEMEELMSGVVSITCSFKDEDIAHRLVPNGPGVPSMVDAVIEESYDVVVKGLPPTS